MRKVLSVLILSGTIILVASMGDAMIGPGRWNVQTVLECDNLNQYVVPIELQRTKINRTHDCFNIHLNLDRELNESYSLEMVMYKEVDGGFKFYSTYTNDSVVAFLEDRTGENLDVVLTLAGVDPPEFPIPPGDWTVKNFLLNYNELPPSGIYGKFDATAYLLFNGVRITCTRILSSFEEVNDDYDEE